MFLRFEKNICRVCMKSDAAETDCNQEKIMAEYYYCTGIQINKDDPLPRLLCDRCIKRLKIANEFKRQSISSFNYLNTFIKEINSNFTKIASSQQINEPFQDNSIDIILNDSIEPEGNADEAPTTDVTSQKGALTSTDTIANEAKFSNSQYTVEYIDDEHGAVEMEHDSNSIPDQQTVTQSDNVANIFTDEDEENEDGEEEIDDEETTVKTDETTEQYEENFEDLIVIETKTPRTVAIKNETAEAREEFVCMVCNKSFVTKSNLVRHSQTHAGLKPYQCEICQQLFTQNSSLKTHMLSHTGEKPFECSFCRKKFTRKRILVMHKRTHTGERPFSCSHCTMSFTGKGGLQRHVETRHFRKKPQVVCTICQKQLSSKHCLDMHMKAVHGPVVVYSCDPCQGQFDSKLNLDAHMESVHGQTSLENFVEVLSSS